MRASMAWAVVMALGVCGCNKDEGSPPGQGGPGPVAALPEAPKPLKGKDLKDSDQLLGGWVTAAAEEDLAGMEFLADGKVLMSFDGGSAEKLSYSVLEGGRLSMEEPNTRQVLIWSVKLAGDQMELSAERAGAAVVERASKRLRRLKKDESLAAAMSALKAERQKLAQGRRDAVYAMIKNADLVIVPATPGPDAPPAVAVGPEVASGQRTAVHDDKPPHRDGITIYPGSAAREGPMQINVAYLQQVEPAPAGRPKGGATLVFEMAGDAKNPRAVAKITYNGKPMELELKRDVALYKEIVGRFDAELARLENLKKPLIEALKDLAMLEGTAASGTPAVPTPNIIRFTLVRDAATGNYTGEGTMTQDAAGGPRTSPFTPPTASILINDDKPMLLIDTKLLEYHMTYDAATKKLSGGWFSAGNPNGWGAELEIKKALDAGTHKKQVEAERKALTTLGAATPFVGLSPGPRGGDGVAHPVSLSLTSDAGGNATGTAIFPTVKLTIAAQGQVADTLAGPRLVVKFGNPIESGSQHGNAHANGLRSQTWSYSLASGGGDEPIVLTDGVNTLAQLTESSKSAMHRKLMEVLSAGLTMQLQAPVNHNKAPQMVMQYKLDADKKKVAGTWVSGSMINGFQEKAAFAGTMSDIGGFPAIVGEVANPEVRNRFRNIWGTELIFFPSASGWGYSACHWASHQVQARGYSQWQEFKQ